VSFCLKLTSYFTFTKSNEFSLQIDRNEIFCSKSILISIQAHLALENQATNLSVEQKTVGMLKDLG